MSFYLKWRDEIEEADLFKAMKAYWRVFHGTNLYCDEQLFLLQRNIKKRLQWRRQLSNVPARKSAAAAAAPAPASPAIPPAPPPSPLPAPQGAARARPVVPRMRRPIRPAGQGQKNNDNLFVRNRGRYKIK